MSAVAERVADKRTLKLIRAFLEAGVMEDGLVSPLDEGTPQGGPLSPLLSNLVLDELDRELERRGHHFVLCRRHAGTEVKLMGCKPPDPNHPFGDLAGGRVGGASQRLK